MTTALPASSSAKMSIRSDTKSDGRTSCPITKSFSPISSQKEPGDAQIIACSCRSQWSASASPDFVSRTSFFSFLSMRSTSYFPDRASVRRERCTLRHEHYRGLQHRKSARHTKPSPHRPSERKRAAGRGRARWPRRFPRTAIEPTRCAEDHSRRSSIGCGTRCNDAIRLVHVRSAARHTGCRYGPDSWHGVLPWRRRPRASPYKRSHPGHPGDRPRLWDSRVPRCVHRRRRGAALATNLARDSLPPGRCRDRSAKLPVHERVRGLPEDGW